MADRTRYTANLVSNTNIFVDISTNRVGIGTTNPTDKLHVIGDATITGTITSKDYNTLSDKRYKTNIQNIPDSLNKVLKLNGVTFDWEKCGNSSAGLIAQDIESVLPELINGDNPKTVNYNGVIGLLVEAVKEQQTQIQMLKNEINELKSKFNS